MTSHLDICASAQLSHLDSGDVLYNAGHDGGIWQLQSGALRLDRIEREGPRFMQLVLPGDLIGLELLAAFPYAYTARAIVPSMVTLRDLPTEDKRRAALVDGLLQQQARTADLIALRTGTAQDRLKRLLLLLSADAAQDQHAARVLPTIKDVAAIIDTAPETVSRIFANLQRSQLLDARQRQSARYSAARLRDHEWPAGMTRSDAGRPALAG